MKNKIIIVLCCLMIGISAAIAQDKKTETIKVFGNCDMCKAKIEGALKKKDGVLSKQWDKDTRILTVTYDTGKISIKQIGEKIAAVGYDNEYATAPDEAYNGLHSCCKYERPKK